MEQEAGLDFTQESAEAEVPAEEPAVTEAEPVDDWTTDPAIAGASLGDQPDWTTPSAPAEVAPEPVTTYTGPPGFNNIPSKPQPQQSPIAPTTAPAPAAAPTAIPSAQRTNSRAANRFKNADGQGVVLPAAIERGVSSMEMQFGSLSFGGLNGDGVEAPAPLSPVEPKKEFSAPISAPVPPQQQQAATSPIRQLSTQLPPQAPVQQPSAPAPTAQNQYYSQQPPAPSQAAQPQPTSGYPTNQQTLQAQMAAYQNQYLPPSAQSQTQAQPAQQTQSQQPEPTQTQPQQGYAGFRGFDQYPSSVNAGQQQQAQQQQQPQQHQQEQHHQQQQQQHQQSYEAPFGAGAFGGNHLFGHGQQGHHQPAQGHQGNEYAQRVSLTSPSTVLDLTSRSMISLTLHSVTCSFQ